MKKVLMIIGGIILGFVILGFAIFFFISLTSEKLVCKSKEGNITIMYDDKTITGYTAKDLTYDMDGQKAIADRIGIDSYIELFAEWFSENTSGTCK